MHFTSLVISTSSLLFPMSSVTFSAMRPPPAPPPEPPSPPAPPEPPDPPDLSPQIRVLSDVSLSHSSCSLCSGPIVAVLFSKFGQPLKPITFRCLYGEPANSFPTFFTMPQPLRPFQTLDLSALSSISFIASLAMSCVPSCSTLFTLGCSFTAVCMLFSGLVPASAITRFDSGCLSNFPSVSLICWFCSSEFDKLVTCPIRWVCDLWIITIALLSAKKGYKPSLVHLPWMCFCNLYHGYSFMEIYVISISPLGGNNCIVGKKIFSGVARRLTISSLRDLSLWISNVTEVPLSDSSARRRENIGAAALAMNLALIAASRMEFTSINCFSDSQVLISLLNTETSTIELQGVLHDISISRRLFTSINFFYVPRSANLLADSLAKVALNSLSVLPG